MKRFYFYILLCTCVAGCLSACNKDNAAGPGSPSALKVDFHVLTDLNVTKSTALVDENKVISIDLFAFDAATGLLEVMQRDIPATTPTDAGVAGEKKVGEILLSFANDGTKKILAVANTTANRVELPATLAVGTTTYADMMEAVTKLPSGNTAPSSPFVMTGYINDVKAGSGSTTISLCRKVAKVMIVNETPGDASDGLLVSSLQLKNVVNASYLFKDGYNPSASDLAFVDYPSENPSSPSINASYYVFPVSESEKMQIELQGVLHGEPFRQTLEIQPQDVSGNPQGVKPNYQYTVKLTGEAKSVSLSVTVSAVQDWTPGGDISGTITGGGATPGGDIAFNGLKWMDRNLGAATADFKKDWDNGIGSFYQWGRNVAFPAGGFEIVSGPLASLADAGSDANKNKFIAGGFKDWLSSSDNTLWQNAASQPCPEGYRMPSDADLLGVFTAKGVILNMVSGPKIQTGEALSGGSSTAHYWGDNTNKVMYGLKRQGTDAAYYLKWEYLKTGDGNAYLRISRWKTDASATFVEKELSAVQSEFAALSAAPEVLELPGAGYITGSGGAYTNSGTGFYWSASLAGDGKVYRAEFADGRMNLTEPYASRASGHSVRCVKQ